MSRVKSPQQILGSLIKIDKNQSIYHVSVEPCFDKKLEASRKDFFNEERQEYDVDCVISTGTDQWTEVKRISLLKKLVRFLGEFHKWLSEEDFDRNFEGELDYDQPWVFCFGHFLNDEKRRSSDLWWKIPTDKWFWHIVQVVPAVISIIFFVQQRKNCSTLTFLRVLWSSNWSSELFKWSNPSWFFHGVFFARREEIKISAKRRWRSMVKFDFALLLLTVSATFRILFSKWSDKSVRTISWRSWLVRRVVWTAADKSEAQQLESMKSEIFTKICLIWMNRSIWEVNSTNRFLCTPNIDPYRKIWPIRLV